MIRKIKRKLKERAERLWEKGEDYFEALRWILAKEDKPKPNKDKELKNRERNE